MRLIFPGRALTTTALTTTLILLAGCGGGSGSNSGSTASQDGHTRAAALAETQAYLGSQPRVRAQAAGTVTPTLVIRARGELLGNIGPIVQLRIDGVEIGSVEVRNTTGWMDYSISAPTLKAGSQVDVVFTNDAYTPGVADRNLIVASITDGTTTVLPTTPIVSYDLGAGSKAYDGLNVVTARNEVYTGGALRMIWPATAVIDPALRLRRQDASRFLLQATFGATPAQIDALGNQTYASWIDDQMTLPVTDSYLTAEQARFDLGDSYRPGGVNHSPYEVSRVFWNMSYSAPDQLRRRVAYALHQIFMISQTDGSIRVHSRPYAAYHDTLNRNAFGNYRKLLEDMALSPAMGLYLSHLRNGKENPVTGRLPDENFAREVMQLFSIGLCELNPDGSQRLDANGRPIETYGNADVMAMAKVFTGFSWGFPDNQINSSSFIYGGPIYSPATRDNRVDLQPLKPYPSEHSTAEKTLFAGKPWSVTLPAGSSAAADLKAALDALFNHPNVGPFIGRQLIQKLVTSHPSPAYVARISAVFADNGQGVRGDLGAVVKAILLDPEARGTPGATFGKLREPVLRITQWRRAFNAASANGAYAITGDTNPAGQRVHNAPSVFGDFRPGYIPSNSSFAARGATAPEFQIVNENTVAGWVNLAESMSGIGLGRAGTVGEVAADYSALANRLASSDVAGLLDDIDLLLFGSTMSPELRRLLVETMASVGGSDAASQLNRARMAVFIALASSEYLVQR
ncbi:MAG: hypothetical protein RLY71_1032 [Pseudomonadota bacterium]|jgi:uncharacterized protein (DUF1800 family)